MQNPWNEHARLYDEAQGERGDPAHEMLFDPAIEKVLGDTQDKVILDAGCGNGYWVRRLAAKASRVIGIDESDELIRIATLKENPTNVEFRRMDVTKKLNFDNESFDLILSSMVLHYLPSLETLASEFARILKPGGQVVICVQHPIFQYHFRAQDAAGKKVKLFPHTVGYFERRKIEQVTLFGKVNVDVYSRPMEDYLNPFFDAGFVLTGFSEPEYTKELLEKNLRYQEVKEVPRVVILRFVKQS